MPFLARAAPLIEEVLKKYPKGVRFVYKQFPLPMHPVARPAAHWSLAAQEQGKFWQMHDVLIQNQPTLDANKAEEYAKQAGLDVKSSRPTSRRTGRSTTSASTPTCSSASGVDVRGTPTISSAARRCACAPSRAWPR